MMMRRSEPRGWPGRLIRWRADLRIITWHHRAARHRDFDRSMHLLQAAMAGDAGEGSCAWRMYDQQVDTAFIARCTIQVSACCCCSFGRDVFVGYQDPGNERRGVYSSIDRQRNPRGISGMLHKWSWGHRLAYIQLDDGTPGGEIFCFQGVTTWRPIDQLPAAFEGPRRPATTIYTHLQRDQGISERLSACRGHRGAWSRAFSLLCSSCFTWASTSE